ncbi:hypothetical protein FG386_001642 [Cryptosporidium ryanae]|uniref:uncharacterized protein n=1 Tax=Cryptosporidium ryanae TaxID=515981 RepID=UPI00351A47E2|nr:hypothetical protein FG386_001642 [Cryptosporidium ryanae]
MGWKQIGNSDVYELLIRVREIESHCISVLEDSGRSKINDDYLIHKTNLFELYNAVSLILDNLETGILKNVFIEKARIDEKIQKMESEIEALRCLNQRTLTNILKFKSKNEYVDKSGEIDVFEREFINIVKSRLKRLVISPESEDIKTVNLNEILSRKNPKTNQIRNVSLDEKKQMGKWIEVNSRLSLEIRELGNSAERIADKANKLTQSSKLQSSKIEEIKALTEFTTGEIIDLNRKVQEIIGKNNTTFCCRITLVILIFVSISIIIALIFKKLI